jgi:hypothetical protein
MLASVKCNLGDISSKKKTRISDKPWINALSERPLSATRHAESRISCEMQNGIPVIRGVNSGYYLFSQDGERLLILSRKQNQSIVINHCIDIVIMEIKDDKIKLGITCPEDSIIRLMDGPEHGGIPLRPK